MTDNPEIELSVVAIAPCCGRVIFAAVQPKACKKELGELAADGYRIEHWTVEKVRQAKFGCKCAKRP